jgi:hypothetical protein
MMSPCVYIIATGIRSIKNLSRQIAGGVVRPCHQAGGISSVNQFRFQNLHFAFLKLTKPYGKAMAFCCH